MVLYRRSRIAGGTFFFTVTLRDRRSSLLEEQAQLLAHVMRAVRARHPWRTHGLVILPDHLHAVWELPEGDADFSGRWRAIKSGFVRALAQEGHPVARNSKGECDLWQRRFWEHTICDALDLQHHIDYLHFNPVKHGHVAEVKDWRWSTFHRYVQQGIVTADWAGTMGDPDSVAPHPGYA